MSDTAPNGAEKKLEDADAISVKLSTKCMTNTIIKDANMMIVAMPLNTPKFVALGFLWTVISEMTVFYEQCEQAAKKRSNILRAGVDFGKRLIS